MDDQQQFSISIDNAAPIIFRHIPPGRFLMGSSHGLPFAPESPEYFVQVKGFWMADAQVSGSQYEALVKYNPSTFQDHPDLPVESVTWPNVQNFCQALNQSSNFLVRLPSEAEWEYACRAATSSPFHFGDSAKDLADYAWFEDNSSQRTSPVGLKKPNARGLYDIIGNVWVCADRWHEDYTGAVPCDGSPWLNELTSPNPGAAFAAALGTWTHFDAAHPIAASIGRKSQPAEPASV